MSAHVSLIRSPTSPPPAAVPVAAPAATVPPTAPQLSHLSFSSQPPLLPSYSPLPCSLQEVRLAPNTASADPIILMLDCKVAMQPAGLHHVPEVSKKLTTIHIAAYTSKFRQNTGLTRHPPCSCLNLLAGTKLYMMPTGIKVCMNQMVSVYCAREEEDSGVIVGKAVTSLKT